MFKGPQRALNEFTDSMYGCFLSSPKEEDFKGNMIILFRVICISKEDLKVDHKAYRGEIFQVITWSNLNLDSRPPILDSSHPISYMTRYCHEKYYPHNPNHLILSHLLCCLEC